MMKMFGQLQHTQSQQEPLAENALSSEFRTGPVFAGLVAMLVFCFLLGFLISIAIAFSSLIASSFTLLILALLASLIVFPIAIAEALKIVPWLFYRSLRARRERAFEQDTTLLADEQPFQELGKQTPSLVIHWQAPARFSFMALAKALQAPLILLSPIILSMPYLYINITYLLICFASISVAVRSILQLLKGFTTAKRIVLSSEGMRVSDGASGSRASMIWGEAQAFLTYNGPRWFFGRVHYYELVGEDASLVWRFIEPWELPGSRYSFPEGYDIYSEQMQCLHATIRERTGLNLYDLDRYDYTEQGTMQ